MSLSGKKVCITGTLSLKRAEVKKLIEAAGGKVMSGVTKNVDIVIIGADAGSKADKAQSLGLDCWDEDKFIKTASGKGGKKASAKKTPTKKTTAKKTTAKKTTGAKRVAPAAKAPPAKKAKPTPKAPAKTGAAAASSGSIPLDARCPVSGASVIGEFGVTLNQTNLGANNNKFYIIQAVQSGANCYCFTRWGRVGESGNQALAGPFGAADAEKEFKKKFKAKSANAWDARDDFVPKAGKYQIVETERAPTGAAPAKKAPSAKQSKVKSKLDAPTQDLVSWILDADMFKSAMASFEIDVKKCPLGAITKHQVDKGFKVLQALDKELQKKKPTKATIDELSGQFYTVIPHSFGRERPPAINDSEKLKQKFDLVAMMGDIEIAQSMQAEEADEDVNPVDEKYGQLKTELGHIKPSHKTHKIVQKYITATKGRNIKLLDLWSVDREGAGKRFDAHKSLGNRKLLWHGTNVAVVAAILKTGLRIMPTASSGSRVGRGIYLASENGKSAGYCRTASVGKKTHGIMFLIEAPMGKAKDITQGDSGLTSAPKGFDSIVARGRTEPDPKQDVTIKLDGKDVVVPQGKPIASGIQQTSFSQSEYLVYKESQARIRFILRCEF
jgi:poly [ADP-ribose] polymerase